MFSVDDPAPSSVTGLLVKLHAAPAGKSRAGQSEMFVRIDRMRRQHHLILRGISGQPARCCSREPTCDREIRHLRRHLTSAPAQCCPAPITCTVAAVESRFSPAALRRRREYDGDGCGRARLQWWQAATHAGIGRAASARTRTCACGNKVSTTPVVRRAQIVRHRDVPRQIRTVVGDRVGERCLIPGARCMTGSVPSVRTPVSGQAQRRPSWVTNASLPPLYPESWCSPPPT